MKNQFGGLIVPLVTPFAEGKIDYVSLGKIMEYCKEGGADGYVCLGTTAESPTLSEKEKDEMILFCLENAGGLPVIAGAGSNCTADAVRRTKRACFLGASGVLSVCPYYNKPPESGIIAHFCAVADAAPLPVILYDVPSRAGVQISVDAIYKLSGLPNIVGVKAAGDDEKKLERIAEFAWEEFALFCGNDFLTTKALSLGAAGLISAAANVLPAFFSEIITLIKNGNAGEAEELFLSYAELLSALYSETNPVAIKYALSLLRLAKNELRLPMCPVSRKNGEKIKRALGEKIKEIL
ncbi:MAG: 4-hydroxy-tetrahydrodipicolinate synthase [Clostridia bacterium]|nr:4-hydroxy-tetrahydrodipicolinate synthase [Clostridia bacterium]